MSTTETESKPQTTIGPGPYRLEGGHIEIDLDDEGVDKINMLLRDSGDAPDELFRKALGLYWLALEARKEGMAVGAAPVDALETEFTF